MTRSNNALPGRVLIYGATGYTGRLVASEAKRLSLGVVLAGRDAALLQPLAATLDLPWRAIALDDAAALDHALNEVDVVVHAAGPFTSTARSMVESCLRTSTHYLDIAGELPVFQQVHAFDVHARERGIMLLPGAGFAIVATDCLCAFVASRMPDARYLRLGLSRPDLFLRGTVQTMLSLTRQGVRIRRNGQLVGVPVGRLERTFDYGEGERPSTALDWADVYTAYYTTGIENIEVYVEAGAFARWLQPVGSWLAAPLSLDFSQALLQLGAKAWPDGPTANARANAHHVIVAEAENRWRQRACARLTTPDGYSFTARAVLAIAKRVLAGDFQSGFQTPASVYGADLVLSLDGVRRENIGDAWPPKSAIEANTAAELALGPVNRP